jgi:hypothetical protein
MHRYNNKINACIYNIPDGQLIHVDGLVAPVVVEYVPKK